MPLTIEFYLVLLSKENSQSGNLENPNLSTIMPSSLMICLGLAASVVANSTIMNAKEPEKHIFHLVTDKSDKSSAWAIVLQPMIALRSKMLRLSTAMKHETLVGASNHQVQALD